MRTKNENIYYSICFALHLHYATANCVYGYTVDTYAIYDSIRLISFLSILRLPGRSKCENVLVSLFHWKNSHHFKQKSPHPFERKKIYKFITNAAIEFIRLPTNHFWFAIPLATWLDKHNRIIKPYKW